MNYISVKKSHHSIKKVFQYRGEKKTQLFSFMTLTYKEHLMQANILIPNAKSNSRRTQNNAMLVHILPQT